VCVATAECPPRGDADHERTQAHDRQATPPLAGGRSQDRWHVTPPAAGSSVDRNDLDRTDGPAVTVRDEEAPVGLVVGDTLRLREGGGFEAKYNALGSITSVQTRRGTNQFHGSAAAYWAPTQLVEYDTYGPEVYDGSKPWDYNAQRPIQGRYEVNLNAQGPILKDHLFFNVGLRYERLNAVQPAGPPRFVQAPSSISESFYGLAGVTFVPVDAHRIHLEGFIDPTTIDYDSNTANVACERTTYSPPLESDPFFQFGMGFSSSAKGDSTEQLFLSDSKGYGHARLDLPTMKVLFVAPYSGAISNRRAELTGTGDGRLFGFFVTDSSSGTQLADITKSNGNIFGLHDLPTVTPGDAYAFSFYGGDFYLYTHAIPQDGGPADGGSDVTRFRPSDGSVEVVKPHVGFRIMGAGVSTCAPTEGPR
jgi:hypothetical protein